jgi:hypothetical protein
MVGGISLMTYTKVSTGAEELFEALGKISDILNKKNSTVSITRDEQGIQVYMVIEDDETTVIGNGHSVSEAVQEMVKKLN